MKESAFSKQIRDDISAIYPLAHVYLIQDSYRTGRKPYDFYVVYGHYFYAVECKAIIGKSLPLGCVTEKQVNSLLTVRNAGICAKAYILIHSDYLKKVLVFSIKKWTHLIKASDTNRSIKFDILVDDANVFASTALLSRNRSGALDKLHWEISKVIY